MNDAEPWRRSAALVGAVCLPWLVASVLLLGVFEARAQGTPPGESGFTECLGFDTVDAAGVVFRTCGLAAEPGVAFELWALTGFLCAEPAGWGLSGVGGAGQPAESGAYRSCANGDTFAYEPGVAPDGRGRIAFRRLYAEGAASAASAASAAGASSGDIDRVVRAVQAVLAGCVLAAGVCGYRVGLS